MADTGHTAGQFEGHTPGPWMAQAVDAANGTYVYTQIRRGFPDGSTESRSVAYTKPSDDGQIGGVYKRGSYSADADQITQIEAEANAALIAAAPSLLARAEAAEERVRVLEAALKTVATKLQQAEIVAYQGGSGSKQRVADLINDANCAARAALTTTGVQHG